SLISRTPANLQNSKYIILTFLSSLRPPPHSLTLALARTLTLTAEARARAGARQRARVRARGNRLTQRPSLIRLKAWRWSSPITIRTWRIQDSPWRIDDSYSWKMRPVVGVFFCTFLEL